MLVQSSQSGRLRGRKRRMDVGLPNSERPSSVNWPTQCPARDLSCHGDEGPALRGHRMTRRSSFKVAARLWLCGLLANSAFLLARSAFRLTRRGLIPVKSARAVLQVASKMGRHGLYLRRREREAACDTSVSFDRPPRSPS